MALTKLNNNSLHGITDGSALKNITGTVLQVVQFVWPTYQQVTQNSYQATGLTKAITPKSSSSNILVNISVNSATEQMLLKMLLLFIEAHLSSKRMKEEYLLTTQAAQMFM